VISVYQEDCSTHEVHTRQNYDRRSLFGCVEQPEDWNWRIEDDSWSMLTSVCSRLIGTAEVTTCLLFFTVTTISSSLYPVSALWYHSENSFSLLSENINISRPYDLAWLVRPKLVILYIIRAYSLHVVVRFINIRSLTINHWGQLSLVIAPSVGAIVLAKGRWCSVASE